MLKLHVGAADPNNRSRAAAPAYRAARRPFNCLFLAVGGVLLAQRSDHPGELPPLRVSDDDNRGLPVDGDSKPSLTRLGEDCRQRGVQSYRGLIHG